MKKIILALIFFVHEAIANSSLTENSFNGVIIGESASSALKKLKGYREEKLEEEGSCYYLSDSAKIGASFMVLDGVIARIEVFQDQQKIQTSKGIGLGSSKSEVIAKYKSVEVSPHPYIAPEGEYLEVKLQNGLGIIFETNHDIVTSYRLGSYPAITYIEGCL